jgi:hypothetical protein
MLAVNDPAVDGTNFTWIVQFAPEARLVPQLFEIENDEAFVPVSAMLPMVSAALPVLVTVTAFAAEVVLSA